MKNSTPRRDLKFLLNTHNALSESLILKSVAELKNYKELKNNISPELSEEDLETENICLEERRNLIDHGNDAKAIRIRNLTLEVLQNKKRKPCKIVKLPKIKHLVTDQSSSNEQNDIRPTELTMLSFNTRCILDLNKRMKLANCMLNSSFDLICLCDTWLTKDVTNASIFLENYEVYKNDRNDRNRNMGVYSLLLSIEFPTNRFP